MNHPHRFVQPLNLTDAIPSAPHSTSYLSCKIFRLCTTQQCVLSLFFCLHRKYRFKIPTTLWKEVKRFSTTTEKNKMLWQKQVQGKWGANVIHHFAPWFWFLCQIVFQYIAILITSTPSVTQSKFPRARCFEGLVCVTTDGNHDTVCYECSRFCISLKITRSTQKPCCRHQAGAHICFRFAL
jgi:hypothetical protein